MSSRAYVVVISVLCVAVIAAGIFLGVVLHNRSHPSSQSGYLRQSGLPSNITTAEANTMELSPVPPHLAANFTLTDQNGKTITLASLRGKDVVLNFMDPHCVDICPIVSQELVQANKILGAKAKNVVFLAVNVNPYFRTLASLNTFATAHKLNTIATFHFLTGSLAALKKVWSAYGVQVEAPNPRKDILHTSITYFINKEGRESYVAAPTVDYTKTNQAYLPANQITLWAKGIAQASLDLS